MAQPQPTEMPSSGQPYEPQVERRSSFGGPVRFDKTINVANILTMLAFTIGTIGFAMSTYSELFSAITKSQHDIANISERLARAETNISNVRTETLNNVNSVRVESTSFMTNLRGELRQDLGELRTGMNSIAMRLSDMNQPRSIPRTQ